MKFYTLTALALLSVTNMAEADGFPSNKWTKTEAAEEVVFQTLHMIDLGQTLDIKNHKNVKEDGAGHFGCGGVVGEHPNDARVIGYMLMEATVHLVITDYLVRTDAPKWVVNGWEMVTIGIQSSVISNNYSLGLRVKF
jgi:hypothetical protein